MDYNVAIADFYVGQEVEGFYILSLAAIKTSVSGKQYLNAALADASGTIDAKAWDYPGPMGQADEGKIVKIRGVVSSFKGSLQLTINRIRPATEHDTYEIADLVPTAPIDADAAFVVVEQLTASIEDEDYRKLAQTMLEAHKQAFLTIPAAKSVHHGFLRGLLMHTGNMLKIADFLAAQYADTVDRSLLLAGTLLHDFAKEQEFSFSKLGLVTDYSIKGNLLGHLVMGAEEVSEQAKALGIPEEKSVLLQHMILSHHGEPEFGAAVRPMCAESELLSIIDLLDSRMEIYHETYAGMENNTFSGRIFALDKKIFRHD